MNKNTVLDKINNLIFGLIVLVSFLTPVFFLPVTYEYFEFNKLYFFIVVTTVMALLWCAKMVVEKKVYFAKSPVDFALLLVLVSFILSTLSSLDKTSSLFGSYGRWFPSLLGFVALYFYYYAISTNVDSARKIRVLLWSVSAGTAIPALFSVINYFGLTIPFLNLFNQKGFLLSGSTTSLATSLLVGLVVSVSLMVNLKSSVKKGLTLAIFILDFVALAIFGNIAFLVVAVLLTGLAILKSPSENINKSKMYLFPAIGALVAFMALFFMVPQTKSVMQRDYPREILPSVKESWIVSSTTLRDFPIFGSGVSTFNLNYPRYKTLSQNYMPTWNVNFDKPHNEFFNIISSLGIFGLLAYIALVGTLIRLVMRSIKVNDAYKGLSVIISAGLVSSLAALFLGYTSFQLAFLTFTLMGLLTAESATNTNKSWAKLWTLSLESRTDTEGASIIESPVLAKKEVLQYVIALPIVALAGFGIYQSYLQYAPEYYMRKAITSASKQDASKSYDYQVKAISINAQRSEYHRIYANTNLALAQALAQKQDLSDQEKTAAQNLLAQALRNIKFASENLNPLDSANWVARGQIYQFLIPIAKDADQFAIQSYNTAIQLDPTNPVLRVELGGIYFAKEDYLSAGNLFKQAVNLKSDYANARYNLAYSLFKLKAYNDAKTEFEAAQSLVEKDGPDYKRVAADLVEIDKLIAQVAGANTQAKPSVESIEKAGATTEPKTPVVQEPLTKPGNVEPAENQTVNP
ncbi:MAG: O-antigen ligase family protein [Patescibacteria group bacterium]